MHLEADLGFASPDFDPTKFLFCSQQQQGGADETSHHLGVDLAFTSPVFLGVVPS